MSFRTSVKASTKYLIECSLNLVNYKILLQSNKREKMIAPYELIIKS